jgi:hypothetical protein
MAKEQPIINGVDLTISRRTLLANCALVTAGVSLSGCCLHHSTSILRPVGLPPVGQTSGDLVIDVHCHIFNGSDLPVKQFLSKVVLGGVHIPQALKEVAGAFVSFLAFPAPCGDEELAFLKHLSDDAARSALLISNARDRHYKRTRKDAQNALQKMGAPISPPVTLASKTAAPGLAAPIELSTAAISHPDASAQDYKWFLQLSFQPETYSDHKSQQRAALSALAIRAQAAQGLQSAPADIACSSQSSALSLPGLVEYVVENDRYRITEAQDYLDTFTGTAQANRNVDLMVAHLVDYDWWLRLGAANGTTLQRQVDVMAEISIYTKGQVHGFAAFDPLREVAYRCRKQHPGHKLWSSLDFVKNAICHQGCLGVKLYPPMGFGACGNATQSPDIWKIAGVPAWLSDGSLLSFEDNSAPAAFGVRLDQVLDELFTWCEGQCVPVMAHSSASNGQNPTLEALAGAQYWIPVIKKYPNLRINFGHLGDLTAIPPCVSSVPPSAAQLMDLFTETNRAYGDSGFDSEILGSGIEPTQVRYAAAYNANPLLATRMLYGTDWNLLLHIGNVQGYQKRFQALADGLPHADSAVGGHTIRERFLGWNAVDYLGLRVGEQNRTRLEAFYKANGLDTSHPDSKPAWMIKVDRLS